MTTPKPTTYAPTGNLRIRNVHSVRLLRDHLRKMSRLDQSASSAQSNTHYLVAWDEYIRFTQGNPRNFHGPIDLWDEIVWLFQCLEYPEDARLCQKRVSLLRHEAMMQRDLRKGSK